jgi:hypothetical protein
MSFDGPAFIRHVAQRLVHEFDFAAGAGTPGLVGAAKEHPARVQLEKLMPEGIAVGSGIVVDSYGGVSKQQDIIIYEKLCPIFTHNGTPEASYYPVEGVVAAGEVKSTLGKRELEDAFEKSQSVKRLRRHAVVAHDGLGPPTVPFRHYATPMSLAATKEEEFNQDEKSLHQVFTFLLCQKFGASPTATLDNAANFYRAGGAALGLNFVASLNDGFIVPHNSSSNSITRAAMEADGLMFCDRANDSFAQLLSTIRIYLRGGKTVATDHYERYFRGENPTGLRVAARVAL